MSQKQNSLTIRDVARLANVSVATAGRVVGGYGSVSEESARKVNQAIKELDFRPNSIAQSMKNKSTKTLGIIVANICNPFFSKMVRAAQDVADRNDYHVIVCNTDEESAKEVEYVETLLMKKVDGLIVASAAKPGTRDIKKLQRLYSNSVPTILVDRKISGLSLPSITTNNKELSYQATKHFIAKGHKRIAIVSGLQYLSSVCDRIEGYKEALDEEGLPFDDSLVVECASVAPDGGYLAARSLFNHGKDMPTAVMPLNSLLTEGVIKFAAENKIAIPGGWSIIGWDDFELASILPYPLSVVDQDSYEMGRLASHQIINFLRDNSDSNRFINLDTIMNCKLILRNSVADCGVSG